MMLNKKTAIQSVVVLSVIALFCGVLLSVFHQLTAITEDEKLERITANLNNIYVAQNGYEKVEHQSDQQVTAMFKAKGEDYYIVVASAEGLKGMVEVFVSIQGRNVVDITKGVNSETPSYIDKIFSEEHKWKFLKNIDETIFDLKSNGGDVDGVATATFSTNAVVKSIDIAVKHYKSYTELINEDNEDEFDILNKIYKAALGYEKLSYYSDDAKLSYKAIGEDYYIVLANTPSRNGVVEVYVSLQGRKIVDINLANPESQNSYLNSIFEEQNKKNFLLDIDNTIFKLVIDGGDVDEVAGATGSSNSVLSCVEKAVTLYKIIIGDK